MPMFSGMYDVAASCNVDCLSLGVFFNTDRVDQSPIAIVMYGDCFTGPPSYGLYLDNAILTAIIGTNEAYVSPVSNTYTNY